MSIGRRKFLTGFAAAGGTAFLNPGCATPEPQAQAQAQGQAAVQPSSFKYSKPIIDAHVHWYPPAFADLIEKEGARNGVKDIKRNEDGELEATVPGLHPYAPRARFRRDVTDVDTIIKQMDERRVNLSVLTQTNPHVLWAPPEFGLKLAAAINDATSALYVKYPDRFRGAITLPLQDIKLSLQELDRAA